MYSYNTDSNRKGKMWGAVWAALYVALWVVLMILVKFPIGRPETPLIAGEGIMINFGDVDAAGGEMDTALTDVIGQQPSQPAGSEQTAEVTPSEYGDVPVERPKTTPKPTNPQAQPVENPRQVNQQALFPGRTAGSTSTSEGTSTGAGNQGNPAGSPDGSHDGTGTGTSGVAYNLSGRSTVGALPRPAYNSRKEGRVVVEITVNSAGVVTNAAYRATGSTGVDNVMIQDALTAAYKARFTPAEAADRQTGTITYSFKMN